MVRSRVVALLVLGSLILAVAGQSAAQVRYVDDKGQSHWVQSEAQVPEKYRQGAATPFGERAKPSCNERDMRREQSRIESAASHALIMSDLRERTEQIKRGHIGTVETSAHLEARLAEDRRNTIGPIESRIDMLKQLAACAAEGK